MAKYLAVRIAGGYLNYDEVVAKYPRYKEQIDAYLEELQPTPEEDVVSE